MLFLDVKPKVSHKWFRKTICSVDIIYFWIEVTGTSGGNDFFIQKNPG